MGATGPADVVFSDVVFSGVVMVVSLKSRTLDLEGLLLVAKGELERNASYSELYGLNCQYI